MFSLGRCNANHLTSKQEIVDIKTNGFLRERRYYNGNKKLIGVVNFKKKGKVATPIDSICFKIKPSGEVDNVLHFNYVNGHYITDENSVMSKFYEGLIANLTECDDFKGVKKAYILIEAMNDVCSITHSVLTNGKQVSEARKVQTDFTSQGLTSIITYNHLQSRFSGLTLDLQSYFDQELLNTVKLTLKNNFLITEDYYFSKGKLTRKYVYNKKGNLVLIIVAAKHKDRNKTYRTVREYNYS